MTMMYIYVYAGIAPSHLLYVAYSVQMDQVIESFNSSHMFSTLHVAGAK